MTQAEIDLIKDTKKRTAQRHYTNLTNEITGATHLDKKYTWKDYIYIIPAILLVVYIIIRSVI